jgi:hypothetical protein
MCSSAFLRGERANLDAHLPTSCPTGVAYTLLMTDGTVMTQDAFFTLPVVA